MQPRSQHMPSEQNASARPHQPSVGLYRRIATLFVVLTLGMLGFAAYIVFAQATVIVLSEPTDVQSEFIVDIASEPTEGEVAGIVYEEETVVERTFPTESLVTVKTHAEGTVTIHSSLYRNQTLIESTRLLTPDGILFRLKERVVVPGFGSATVPVFADEAGPENAVGEATFTIPGLNESTRKFFEVETDEPIEGGEIELRLVTEEDMKLAKQALLEEAKEELDDVFRQRAVADGAPMDAELISHEVVEVEVDAEAGDEAEDFTMKLRVRGTAVFYAENDFLHRVRAALQERLPFDKRLKEVSNGGLGVSLEKADIIGARANLRVQASGTAQISSEAPLLNPEKITGVTVDAAVQYLEQIEGVSSASVEVRPFWAGRLPDVAGNITIEVR